MKSRKAVAFTVLKFICLTAGPKGEGVRYAGVTIPRKRIGPLELPAPGVSPFNFAAILDTTSMIPTGIQAFVPADNC